MSKTINNDKNSPSELLKVQDKMKADSRTFSKTANFLSAFVASIATGLVHVPFDAVKIKMQQMTAVKSISANEALKMIYREGGVLGFYKGSMLGFGMAGIMASLRMGTYQYMLIRSKKNEFLARNDFFRIGLTSVMIACQVCWVGNIVEHTRVRLNNPLDKGKYSGSLDALVKITKQYGITGIMRGYWLLFSKEVFFYWTFFSIYEKIREEFTKKGHSTLGQVFSSAFASPLAWCVIFPIDTLKTLRQSESLESSGLSTLGHLKSLQRRKMLPSLYSGLSSVVVRSFPLNVIFFNIWEPLLLFFESLEKRSH